MRESWHRHFAESPDVLKTERRRQTVVRVLDLEIGGDEFITMAGPCSVETEAQLLSTAVHVRRSGARVLRGGAFKPRSSPYSFQGLGLEGLKLLARARQESGLAIVTEVMSEEDVAMVAEYADILQIGSRNMENYSLLEAAARSGRPILLKRGMVATVADFLRSAQCVLDNGNPNVILCERGIRTFETATRNTFDVATIVLLKQISHLPVIADPSHAAGYRELVPALARVAVAAEADGLLVEVHPHPDKAWSDGEQTLDFDGFDEMMASLEPFIALRAARLPVLRACRRGVDGGRWMRGSGSRVPGGATTFFLAMLFCGFTAGTADLKSTPILVTAAPAYEPLAALRGAERFPKGAQLLLVHEGKDRAAGDGLRSHGGCDVSFDAKTVLFAGKKAASDPWQIWELTVADHAVRQVIAGAADAVRPFYLPGRRLVYARRGSQGFQVDCRGA